ncbi:MAG TPA: hypothetical protein VGJ83_00870 [Gemmatimonadales bacterium]|jgi:hypothetical protein
MRRHLAATALLLGALPVAAPAQVRTPLLKTDLIELLSSPVIASGEVAVLVRRNCLAFRPTERDLSDIRRLGASPDVLTSIAACGTVPVASPASVASAAAPASDPTALQVVVRQPRIVAAAGSQERVVVLAARGGMPQSGVPISLRGSGGVDGSGRDVSVATDDSGFAVLPVRVGRRLTTYRLEIVTANGGALPGRPTLELVVRPGPPYSAVVEPAEVVFEEGLDSILPVTVTVRDSVGHPIAGEPVVLAGNPDAVGFPPDTAITDSLGRARMVVRRAGARRGATLPVRIRGRQLTLVDALVGAQLLEGNTGFLPDQIVRGMVHNGLGVPLVFGARTRLGRPATGRSVSFRGVNAQVSPAVATTDSAGRAHVDVTLGDRAGSAVILATIDSIEKQMLLQVEPGPPTELSLEYNGTRVDGRWLVVGLDTTFVVRVRARDAYGNATGVSALARMMRATPFNAKIPIARLVSVEEEESTVALTLKAVGPGRATVKLHMGDISTSLWLEVVRGR